MVTSPAVDDICPTSPNICSIYIYIDTHMFYYHFPMVFVCKFMQD